MDAGNGGNERGGELRPAEIRAEDRRRMVQAIVNTDDFYVTMTSRNRESGETFSFVNDGFRGMGEALDFVREWWDMSESWEHHDLLSVKVTLPGGDMLSGINEATVSRTVEYRFHVENGPLSAYYGGHAWRDHEAGEDRISPLRERFLGEAEAMAHKITTNIKQPVYVIRVNNGDADDAARVVYQTWPTSEGRHGHLQYDEDTDDASLRPPVPTGEGEARNWYAIAFDNPNDTTEFNPAITAR
jgi:hypothetical protein